MNQFQRTILAIYCILFAYCCIWVPWHISHGDDYYRIGYGWLWAGTSNPHFDGIAGAPDIPIITLRIIALSTISAAAFFLAPRR